MCYASPEGTENKTGWGNIISSGDTFVEEGKTANEGEEVTINNDDIQKEFNDMYNILFAIGVVFSVIIGAMLGLKYMFGSIEEQVKVKESLIGYVIGCFVIFGAFGIWKFVILILANV